MCDLNAFTRRSVETLIQSGVLDRWGNRKQLTEALDAMMARSKVAHSAGLEGQNSLFGEDEVAVRPPPVILSDTEPSPAEMVEYLAVEKELLGVSLSSTHPVTDLYNRLKDHFTLVTTAKAVGDTTVRQKARSIKIVGLVREVRAIKTKKGDAMAFVTLEDAHGELPCVAFPDAWRRLVRSVAEGVQLLCEGKLSYNQARDEQSLHLEQVRTYSDLHSYQAKEPATIERQPVSPAAAGQADDATPPVERSSRTVVPNDAPPQSIAPLAASTDAQEKQKPRKEVAEPEEVLFSSEPTGDEFTAAAPPPETDRRDQAESPTDAQAEVGRVVLFLQLDEGKPVDTQVAAVRRVRRLNEVLTTATGANRWTVELVVSVNGLSTGFRYPEAMVLDPDSRKLSNQLQELGVQLRVV